MAGELYEFQDLVNVGVRLSCGILMQQLIFYQKGSTLAIAGRFLTTAVTFVLSSYIVENITKDCLFGSLAFSMGNFIGAILDVMSNNSQQRLDDLSFIAIIQIPTVFMCYFYNNIEFSSSYDESNVVGENDNSDHAAL